MLLAAWACVFTQAKGQNPHFPIREVSNILPSSALSITTPSDNVLYIQHDARNAELTDANFSDKIKYKSNYTLVKLSIDHSLINLPPHPYTYKMEYILEGSTKVDDTIYNFSVVDTVAVAYSPDSLSAFQDQDFRIYPKLYNAKLSVIQFIEGNSLTPGVIPLTVVRRQNLNIELAMQYQPYLKTHYQPADMGLYMTAPGYDPARGLLNISWLPSVTPYLGKVTPAQYELEWTYADDYGTGSSPLAASQVFFDFKNNATRIVTDSNGYQIPIVYPRGYLAFRVRMVRVDSTNYTYPIYGPWSLSTSSATVSSIGTNDRYYIDKAHMGDTINWNYSIQFAEGGKYKHVQSYYDGLLKNRQTITRFNSNPSQLLVTEKIYDFEGRPEITTIPSVVQTDSFGFQQHVSISGSTSAPYSASDFDQKPNQCPDEYTVPPFTDNSLANKYYSPLNTDTADMQKFVPRANGFPFLHTQLSPGFSDRVDIIGGAGDSLQIGRKHDVRIQYMGADQSELDRMLGINAGYNSYYTKTVSTDQNGQQSLSIKDFRGRPVLTSLTGAAVDTTKIAIMFNEEVPNASLYREDKLDSATQLVVGHQKIYDGSLFMDETALTNIQYEYAFVPYPVCSSGGTSIDLSVKGYYDYTFTDDCGVLELHRSGTIGTTGVLINPSIPPSTVSDTLTLKKGKHSINKTLSIRTDEIYAAVDSFFALGSACTKTEAEFIKEEVENTPFPCPDSLDNPCVLLERRMEEELFPDGKYGYLPGTSIPPGPYNASLYASQSIFVHLLNDSTAWRTTAPCVTAALNAISFTRFGVTYTNLASIPRDTFLAIFRTAGAYKYDIARALLPLHPEFCKLQNCFIDTFERRFKSFPDSRTAIKAGFFNLDEIVNKDAQLRARLSSFTGISVGDSLKTVMGGRLRMDTLLAEMAYCMSDQSGAYTDAKQYFRSNIQSVTFPDDRTADLYFNKLRAMYLQNRAKYKSMALTAGSTDCSGCSDTAYQIKLIPPPLVPVMYTPTGGIDTSAGSFFALFAGDSSMQAKLAYMLFYARSSLITDTALQHRYEDTAHMYVHYTDSLLNAISKDSLTAKLANCYANTAQMTRLRDTLQAMIARAEVHNGAFMPWQVRYAITSSGLSLSGLCHPYLFNYDYYQTHNTTRGTCRSGPYYDFVRDFFNTGQIINALKQTTTTINTFSLSWSNTNLFASQISAALGSVSTIGLRTNYVSASKITRLVFYNTANPATDSLVVTLHASKGAPYNSGQSPFYQPDGPMNIDHVYCYLEDPQAQADGYIGRFMFRLGMSRTDTVGTAALITKYSLSGWNNKVTMSEETENPISGCVACTEFKGVYKDFADSMSTYGGYAGDHPLFIRSLRNFANYNLKRCFGDAQYRRFLNSCALADSMHIPAYGGYGRISFPNSGYNSFADFRQALANSTDSINVRLIVLDSTASGERAVIDYSSIPYPLLRKFDGIINANGGQTGVAVTSNTGILLVPQNSISGATIDTVLAGTGLTYGSAASVYVKKGTKRYAYYRYTISPSGVMNNAQLSVAAALVDTNLYLHSVNGYWFPTVYATLNRDYYKPEKQQYLRYAYAMQAMSPPNILDTLQPSFLEANVAAFGGTAVSYVDPANPKRHTDLYFSAPKDTFSGYSVLEQIFGMAGTYLGSNHVFLPTTSNSATATTAPSGHSLKLYRCADGLYWYRYFGAGKKLYDVYVRMPQWVFENVHPQMTLAGVRHENGDSASRRFTLLLTRTGIPSDTFYAAGSTDFDLTWSRKLQDVMMGNEHPNGPDDPASGEVGSKPNCEQQRLDNAIYIGKTNYANYIDSFKHALRTAFYNHVMSHLGEKLWVEYADKRFAYTLYSYDLAGNLITTVPPAGVHPLNSTNAATVKSLRANKMVAATGLPAHDKVTHYEYNTANKPVRELTPDAGQKTMTYDAKGNVILSQTQRQKAGGLFTYMLYDGQNRLTETGQVQWADCPVFADQPLYNKVNSVWVKTAPPNACACENLTDSLWTFCAPNTANTYDNLLFAKKIRRLPRTDVVATVYDTALINMGAKPGMSVQQNLRSRITANMYFENVPPDTAGLPPVSNYTHATHYSYDVAGNVKTLVQEFPSLEATKQRFKRVDYEYDLISGKVNMLAYNRGFGDQFYQRYGYDADNRIVRAETSHDGFIWKRDAAYTYYQHGPLARVSLGDQRVQGMDYAYTIQGWLKSINGDRTDTLRDLGNDGRKSSVTPKDVYATTIDYFKNDYQPIGATPVSYLATTGKSLFNGNIARLTTDVTPCGPITAIFTYDQMNRIRRANYAKDSAGILQFNDWYASSYKYDLDGNILALNRKACNGNTMDSLIYSYPNGAHNNKLTNVLDYASYSPMPKLDLPQYTVTSATRFTYDADGNLTNDLTSNATGIKWNIYGKMTDLTSVGTPYHFQYDAMGNRVLKKNIYTSYNSQFEDMTYYVRDAQGNILAEYVGRDHFNTQAKIVTITGIRTSLTGGNPTGTWIGVLNGTGLTTNPAFVNYITGIGSSTLQFPAGVYLAASPSLLQHFINNAPKLSRTLCRYAAPLSAGTAGDGYVVADALLTAMADDHAADYHLSASEVLTQINHTILFHPDSEVQKHAMAQLISNLPSVAAATATYWGIGLNTAADSARLLYTFRTEMNGKGPEYLRDMLYGYYSSDTGLLRNWLREVTSDELYVAGVNDTAVSEWALHDGYVDMTRNALVNFGDAAAEARARYVGDKSLAGIYGFASWWGEGLSNVIAFSDGGEEGLATVAYLDDPLNYLQSLTSLQGPALLDTALAAIDDGSLDITGLATAAGTTLTAVQNASLSGAPYLLEQGIRLSNHHMYGSSRLGISYAGDYACSYDDVLGLIDIRNVIKPRHWYSYELNAPIKAGRLSPYGNGLDSAAQAVHDIGLKQYELVNHLGNVQETVSDKKYSKDINGDSIRDEFRAAPIMVYDYYPFGELMVGRSFDSAGLCVTLPTSWTEYIQTYEVNGGPLHPSGGGGAVSVGSAGLTTSTSYGTGVTTTGSAAGSGFSYTISGIPNPYITLGIKLSALAGAVQVRVYKGTGTSGVQLASANFNYTSPIPTMTVGTSFAPIMTLGTSTTGTITVTVTSVGSYSSSQAMFTVDSLFYTYAQSVHVPVFSTRCGNPVDQYEFGFNGQMKMNEIAGIGNHNQFKFREQDSRLGRFWSVDPLTKKYPFYSPFAFAGNRPVDAIDFEGLEPITLVQNQGDDRIIYSAAQKETDNTRVHLFAHGNIDRIANYVDGFSEILYMDAKSVDAMLKTKSDLWRNRKYGDQTIIVLHSCLTGRPSANKEKPNIAYLISIAPEFKNAYIIAPDEEDHYIGNKWFRTGEEIGPRKTNKDGKSIGMGHWLVYQNGILINMFNGNINPKSFIPQQSKAQKGTDQANHVNRQVQSRNGSR